MSLSDEVRIQPPTVETNVSHIPTGWPGVGFFLARSQSYPVGRGQPFLWWVSGSFYLVRYGSYGNNIYLK